LVDKLEASDVLEQALKEGFITDDTVAIDATHFEARDQAPPKQDEEKLAPRKRGRKSKAERDQWICEQAEEEANKARYDKKIEAQLTSTVADLREDVRRARHRGDQKNSQVKNGCWTGCNTTLAVWAA